MRGKYLSKLRLEELDGILLSDRDKAVLRTLQDCRYLSSRQISRLLFTDSVSPTAAVKAANRCTRKLKDFGVVDSLERRIGGSRAGGGSYVWSLTESGINLLNLGNPDYSPRKRTFEPSPNFMQHTLAVSETYVQLIEVCRQHSLNVVKTELEPGCWRSYTGEDGKPASMKPDMFAITGNDEFEDCWFFEIDMNTESPSVVAEKCRRYTLYYKSGIEQEQNGVFPLVVWIAFSDKRKNRLQQCIDDCLEISERSKALFTVIMPDEFEKLLCQGAKVVKDTP